jgi:hypothetical protein
MCLQRNRLVNALTALCSVGGSRNVTTSSSPVDVDVLALWVLLTGELWLDSEGVGTEVVTLSLEKIGWKILGSVSVVERQSGAEGWCWDTPKSTLADNVSPSRLCVVDGLVEEVVEEEVLKVWVRAVGLGDVLEEDRSDDAATTPHKCDLWLVELPGILLGGL